MEALLKEHLYGWHGPLLVNQGFASHIGWALAVPLLGFWLARERGLLIAGVMWVMYTLFREFIEEPLDPTTVSDLVSRIGPTAIVVAVQVFFRRPLPRSAEPPA
jgi:hypothetical protein